MSKDGQDLTENPRGHFPEHRPEPEPFSWRKLFRQLGLQMAVMSLSVVVFKYFVADRIEAEMAERALEQAEGSRDSTLGGL